MIKVERTVIGTNQLTLEVAKLWMKVDGDAEDVLITSLIDEAKDIMESYINYTITPSTITVTASPRVELCLPYGPVQSITSVKDVDGEDNFYIKEETEIGYLQTALDVFIYKGVPVRIIIACRYPRSTSGTHRGRAASQFQRLVSSYG